MGIWFKIAYYWSWTSLILNLILVPLDLILGLYGWAAICTVNALFCLWSVNTLPKFIEMYKKEKKNE